MKKEIEIAIEKMERLRGYDKEIEHRRTWTPKECAFRLREMKSTKEPKS